MSAYTTRDITREDAIQQIRVERARRMSLIDNTNKELEDLMFYYFGDTRLENYIIENE